MEAFVIDDEELDKDYNGLCLRRATAMATRGIVKLLGII
jgi:hypothetical protein